MIVSAVAAQGASATTAFTCKEGSGTFTSTCEEGVTGGTFGHVAIAAGTTTELSAKANGTTKLKSVAGGVVLELQATGLSGTGTMTNSEVGGEMRASGTGVITYEGVTVAQPSGKGCKVVGGKVVTNTLAASTAGLTKQLKFTPNSGTVFAPFTVEGCSVSALNKEYKAEGSVVGTVVGTMTEFSHAGTTTQGTLTLGGQKAGLEGTLTLLGRLNSSQAFTALSVT
jgi:hypothetical protein